MIVFNNKTWDEFFYNTSTSAVAPSMLGGNGSIMEPWHVFTYFKSVSAALLHMWHLVSNI